MSASQEKRRRQIERQEGTEKRQLAQKEQQKKKNKSRIITAVVGSLVVLFIIAVIVVNSNLFYTSLPAVKIDGKSYSAAELNYYFYNSYYSFMNQFGDYEMASQIISPDVPLDQQYASEDQTWADYFRESAVETLKQINAICLAADEAGFTLSQESEDLIAEEMASLESAYESYGYQSVKQYLVASFGRGSSAEIVEQAIRKNYLADEYSKYIYDSFSYSDEELSSFYDEHKNEYDMFTFRRFLVSGAEDTENGIDSETAMAQAKELAESMAANADSEESFAALALENASEDDKSSYEDEEYSKTTLSGSSIDSTYSEWIYDESRKEGDTTAIETTDGYYVLYFVNRDDNSYNSRQVRHILIEGVTEEQEDTGEELTEEEQQALTDQLKEDAKAVALSRAEEILDEWNAGPATEDSFAVLAEEYSSDSGSNANGGLYDSVYKNQMVEEFDAFVFDPSRKPGDTGIVYGESYSYFGYHVMYYVGEGKPYNIILADSVKRNEDIESWRTAETDKYTFTEDFAFRFVG